MKLKPLITVLLSLAAIGVTAVAIIASFWYIDNRVPAFKQEGNIKIYPETTVDEILASIDTVLQPRFRSSLKRVFKKEHVAERRRDGLYYFSTNHTARYLARAITRGWQDPVDVVISGSMRTKQAIADKVSANLMVTPQQILDALNDSLFLSKYNITPSEVFEMVLPDTYEMYWSVSVKEIFDRLKSEYDKYWTPERVAQAEEQGLTPAQVSILASIVAEESNKKDEYPKIARVYLNRLKKGMKLQACPTVCYIYGYSIKRVLYSHLQNPSPYNTYLYEGLPPTPICVPGKEHIEAVLNPDPTPYLYFCADASFNGRNVFSKTYLEHSIKADAYRKALDERNKAAQQIESEDGQGV